MTEAAARDGDPAGGPGSSSTVTLNPSEGPPSSPPEEPPPAGTRAPAGPPPSAPGEPDDDDRRKEVLSRAGRQYDWYDSHATTARIAYWAIKVVQLVLGAAVPVAAGVEAPKALTGSLGALIVVLEGVQQLFQFHNNWIRYRVTAAALAREINLFTARVADYAPGAPTPAVDLLALRTEDISSGEATTWAKAAASPPTTG